MRVKFLDLYPDIQEVKREIDAAFQRVLKSTAFTLGKEVEAFERAFADYCGAKHCIAVNSGTSALHVALLAHGVGKGDEVITQPNSFFATAEAISYTRATPVFVDVLEGSFQMDVSKLETVITKHTKAIIPVFLYGLFPDMEVLKRIARKHNLPIIEDAAQAHGSTYKTKRSGAFGNTACFSFYPSKSLGALGEAGAVVTNNTKLAEHMRVLRNHGQYPKDHHTYIGYNYRMEQLQGAFLNVKLKKLDSWIRKRKAIAKLYTRLLQDAYPQVVPMQESAEYTSNYYVYVIRCGKRDALVKYLKEQGIDTQVHYPTPIHLQPAYKHLRYKRGSFPVAETHAKEVLSLPMYPSLTKQQIEYVAQQIKKFYTL